jgi:hypothetical protein
MKQVEIESEFLRDINKSNENEQEENNISAECNTNSINVR